MSEERGEGVYRGTHHGCDAFCSSRHLVLENLKSIIEVNHGGQSWKLRPILESELVVTWVQSLQSSQMWVSRKFL